MVASGFSRKGSDPFFKHVLIPIETVLLKLMNGDPFEQFERSRGGLLIPVLIFIVGAVLTTFAVSSLNRLVRVEALADQPPAAIEQLAMDSEAGKAGENEGAVENRETSSQ